MSQYVKTAKTIGTVILGCVGLAVIASALVVGYAWYASQLFKLSHLKLNQLDVAACLLCDRHLS